MGKLAFVTPRYGEGVLGGSESRVREEARGLAARGHEVEVLTTCARDHHTWTNEWPAGAESDGLVTVRRFETVPRSDPALWASYERRIHAGERLSETDELAWINSRFRVPELYFHIAECARDYDALIYSPYLFWTTLYCIGLAPERSILMPCLHNEPYVYLQSVRAALAGAGSVWFQSEPEHQLGHRLAPLPSHQVVGSAVHVPERYDPVGFRERHGLERPFVLYAGRREEGKGWPQAVRGFGAAIVRYGLQLDLVTIGAGDANIPPILDKRIIDLGYLDDEEVANAFAAAEAYLQPSPNESFSRVIMESWLASTAVIANMSSEVVAWHCERSGGGLVYGDEIEMAECLRMICEAPKLAAELAASGREYVLENYTWPKVLDGMETALEQFGVKVLVIGSLPPPVTDRARGLLAEVIRRRSEGATVEVLSPTGHSVAHKYLEMPGPASAIEIKLASRGADAVIVQLQPGFPVAETAGRSVRAVGLGALTAALRGVPGEVTLRLHSIHDLPHGIGGRAAEGLWAVASQVEVGDEETMAHLAALPGSPLAGKLSIAVPAIVIGNQRELSSELGGDATFDGVTATVRARAANERHTLLTERADPAGRVRAQPRVALWEWLPQPGVGAPDWGDGDASAPSTGSAVTKAARAVLYAAEARSFTRPLARGARIARRLAREI